MSNSKKCSDNKYLKKVHNIIKALPGTLNSNKKTKTLMSKRLPYPDFENGHVNFKLNFNIKF